MEKTKRKIMSCGSLEMMAIDRTHELNCWLQSVALILVLLYTITYEIKMVHSMLFHLCVRIVVLCSVQATSCQLHDWAFAQKQMLVYIANQEKTIIF